MPGRKFPLITGERYHVFNRGIDKRIIFMTKSEYQRAIDCLSYYQFASPPMKFSKYQTLQEVRKSDILAQFQSRSNKLVDIYAFCLMPNHFHFLLTQLRENGIAKFMANFQNSYTRYFNIKHDRIGSLLLDQFKGVQIETDEQFIHVSRYIHLNPVTAYIVKKFIDLYDYPWSSYPEYLKINERNIVNVEPVLSLFKNQLAYEGFLADQVDYQRALGEIKGLMLE